VTSRPLEVLAVFAKLGVTSFGGPIAHLGYFRAELVERRRWVSEKDYGDLVALCQFLPGPASSQVGFALGLARGGLLGALFAFLAFTLPSAILLVAFAFGAAAIDSPLAASVLSGLKVVAVAIVAHAVIGMARTLTPDLRRILIGVAAAALALLLPGAWGQIGAIVLGAAAGILFCRAAEVSEPLTLRFEVPRWLGAACLSLFALVLVGLPIAAATTDVMGIRVADAFFRSGALVFGGGHVVLPLLHSAVVDPGWVGEDAFLAGYGAAQAVPGPLFTFAAYLGALIGGVPGAILGLAGIFLPGFLLLVGVLPFWDRLRERPAVRAVMRGANAAVVGILAAALITPVATSALTTIPAAVLAVVCVVLLMFAKLPPWVVVLAGALGGLLIGVFSASQVGG
jgi:chromate transporter